MNAWGMKNRDYRPISRFIYIFIHHIIIESTEQKVQQKSTQKKKKITTM